MPVPTTPFPCRATIALMMALGLATAPTGTLAQTAGTPGPLRVCTGNTLTLAWGAVVRDSRGPCRASARPVQGQAPAAHAQSTAATTTSCPNRRSYMGGALLICGDPPRARSPR